MSSAYGLCPCGCGAVAGDLDGPDHKHPHVLVRLGKHHPPGSPGEMCDGSYRYAPPLPVAAKGDK